MQEQIKYQNHLGEEIDFGRNGVFVAASDLHDYRWSVAQKNNKISSFRREVVQKKLLVTIFCTTVEEGLAARDRLVEIAEKDILAMQPGRIIVGDYYFKCYISESKKKRYLFSRRQMQAELALVSDEPFWVREVACYFRNTGADGTGFGYSYDYPVDYVSGFSSSQLNNPSFAATNFRMTIYGPCSDPAAYINGHAYAVTADLTAGEYLTINSAAKTIIKTALDGTKTNMFHNRNRDSYIFERIPPGENTLSRNGDFNVDVVLLEERSEPKWT